MGHYDTLIQDTVENAYLHLTGYQGMMSPLGHEPMLASCLVV